MMRILMLAIIAASGCVDAPPQDEWIAFSSGRTGQGDIHAVQPGARTPRLLIGTEASEGTIRYDPSNGRLIHSRFDSLAVMLVLGDSELFPDPHGDVAPVWSSAGEIAFVVESNDDADVFLAGGDGSGRRRLTSDPLVERYPAWHPDGRRPPTRSDQSLDGTST